MHGIEEKSSDARLYMDQVCNMVQDRWDRARTDYSVFYSKVPRWYDAYRGIYSGASHPFRNNVSLPILFATVQSDVATKVQMSWGAWPIVQMAGYGPEDADIARKNEILISAQMKDCGSFRKATDFYLSADLYGTGILQYGWRTDIRDQLVRVPLPSLAGMPSEEQIIQKEITRFDGPDWNVIDILDFAPSPNAKTIEEMDFCLVRQWMDLDTIKALGKTGYFNKKQVDILCERGPSHFNTDEYKERRNSLRTPVAEDDLRRLQRFSKPVQLIEMWGIFPDELIPKDGQKHRVVTIADGKICLRNEPNPHWDGAKPFIAYSPQPDPHYFFGPGKIEIAAKLQYTANRIANQKLDVLDLGTDPVMFYDQTRFTNKQELYIRSGKAIPTNGNPSEVVMPWMPDLRGVQLAYQEIDQLWQMSEIGTGVIRDTVGGAAVSKRQTAREYQGRKEGSMTRLGLEARLAEENFVEPLANAFRNMNRQYLRTPKMLRILGVGGLVNTLTGQPMPMEPLAITLDELYPDYDVRAVGASQQLSKEAAQQNMVLAIQALAPTPAGMMMNWNAVGRQVLQGMDFRNVDELLPNMPPQMVMMLQQMLMQMNQQGQQGGPGQQGDSSDGAEGGEMDGTPSNFNDGQLGQQFQPNQSGY